jgi:hypothetical protein
MTAWKSAMLAKLFRGLDKCPLQLLPAEINAELELMQAGKGKYRQMS